MTQTTKTQRWTVVNECEILEAAMNDMDELIKAHGVKIGFGSYGVVYNVLNYAVKHFRASDCDDGKILEKLQGIECFPKLYAYNKDYMIYELIDGRTVSFAKDEFLNIQENWKERIADNVKKSAKSGLIPSDMHGSNIMITKSGEIKIVDVGCFFKFIGSEEKKNDEMEFQIREIIISIEGGLRSFTYEYKPRNKMAM